MSAIIPTRLRDLEPGSVIIGADGVAVEAEWIAPAGVRWRPIGERLWRPLPGRDPEQLVPRVVPSEAEALIALVTQLGAEVLTVDER